jgi:glucosamine--fructose-6-phosphate aminotransferase (isomerizing)
MCGIVGVTGQEPAVGFLVDGLASLEYRGYDSVGIVVSAGGTLWRRRSTGRVQGISRHLDGVPGGTSGLGHTRWATHGAPTEANAHPHVDCDRTVAVVHNGIIENHRELRAKLVAGGHRFTSDTDSEVLAHLLEELVAGGLGLAAAVRAMVPMLDGSLALAVVHAAEPGLVVAARRGSPLVIGRTAGAAYLASDAPALLPFTRDVYAVGDDCVAELRPGRLAVTDLGGRPLALERRGLGFDPAATSLGDFPDFTSKEIHEQPKAVTATLAGRRTGDRPQPAHWMPAGLDDPGSLRRIVLVGCGTSYHAGLAARPAFEDAAALECGCEIASEFRYGRMRLDARTLVVGISQSGETIDTLYALREAAARGARVLAVTNVVGSAMAREVEPVLYTRAGPEIGVAATKTHLAQVVALHGLALALAGARGTLGGGELAAAVGALGGVAAAVAEVLAGADAAVALGRHLAAARDFFFLGRGPGYATALEGALKLKEIAYVRAEAYPAGELKHGPIALVEPGVVVVAVVGSGRLREKMLSNVAEVQARGATVVLVADAGDAEAAAVADHVLAVPAAASLPGALSHVVDVVALQLLAYGIAKERGCDVDKPRNLAKTVTVE